MIRIAEIEQTFKDLFEEEEGLVQSVDTVYEMAKNEDFYRLVISIHGLNFEDISIIHTKFIFKTDIEKRNAIDMSFIYLYDINCNYHKIEFDNALDLKEKIEDIIKSGDFGQDILTLSDFIQAPAMFLNYYMKRYNITDYSVFDVKYEPKFKTSPCDETTFDFDININDNYMVNLSIKKVDKESSEDDFNDYYNFQFKFMDEITTKESDTLDNIHYFIGQNVASILDKKLKS
jgi:hypothetical protein